MSILLFDRLPTGSLARKVPGTWNQIQTIHTENLTTLRKHYGSLALPCKALNPLIRLILATDVPRDLDLDTYYSLLQDDFYTQPQFLGWTTAYSPGKPVVGAFYSPDQPEWLLAVDEPFDAQWVHDNWRSARSVYPLIHPKTDLGYQYPNGKHWSSEMGMTVIAVNTAMFMVQYRAYYQEEMAKPAAERTGTLNRFIGGTILTNMIRTGMEISWINRLMAHYYQREYVKGSPRRHMVNLLGIEPHLDATMEGVLKAMQASPHAFESVLANLPGLTQRSHRTLLWPDQQSTRASQWLLHASRLPYLLFLLDLRSDVETNPDRQMLRQALAQIRRFDVVEQARKHLDDFHFFEFDSIVSRVFSHD